MHLMSTMIGCGAGKRDHAGDDGNGDLKLDDFTVLIY